MSIIQFTLSRKTDADLISFFAQQDKKTASLVLAALLSYVQGTELPFRLLPVTVTEQVKNRNVYILVKKDRERADIRCLEEFLHSIPARMKSMYIKGILRYTYGSLIYQTEATVPRENIPPVYIMPEAVPPAVPSGADTSVPAAREADDDIFNLFESLLE